MDLVQYLQDRCHEIAKILYNRGMGRYCMFATIMICENLDRFGVKYSLHKFYTNYDESNTNYVSVESIMIRIDYDHDIFEYSVDDEFAKRFDIKFILTATQMYEKVNHVLEKRSSYDSFTTRPNRFYSCYCASVSCNGSFRLLWCY